MIYSVHQPQYLPWLGFFDKIDKSDAFVFLDDVQYKHREYQNRNKVRTKDGWIWLTVPVKFYRGDKIRDVRIDNSRDWRTQHLKSLKSWYSHAEHFDKYFSFFESLYKKEWDRLCGLNVAIIEFLLESLAIKKPVYFESELNAGGEKTQRIINIGKKLKADVYLSGAGGRDYLEENKFSESNIGLRYQDFVHPVYRQQFLKEKEDFIPYMSVVDLMFNEGERSLGIIRGGKNNV
ncbi:MAG: WbqC family protein [Candidatus Omnitrophica bacterium]|nr:WbqC family protein [Candidatus Omnitrophota bacterium]